MQQQPGGMQQPGMDPMMGPGGPQQPGMMSDQDKMKLLAMLLGGVRPGGQQQMQPGDQAAMASPWPPGPPPGGQMGGMGGPR